MNRMIDETLMIWAVILNPMETELHWELATDIGHGLEKIAQPQKLRAELN
jgi:hypothetical protein